MRFKDFEITIRGDFPDGESEEDFRKAIARKLGGLSDGAGNADRQDDADTVEKIDSGDARWSPPLQQHLDVVKQSLKNTKTLGEVSNQIIDLDSAKKYYEKFHETADPSLRHQQIDREIQMCESCGRLLLDQNVRRRLGESSYRRVQQAWQQIMQKYQAPALDQRSACSQCSK
jgi:hypothetical protein